MKERDVKSTKQGIHIRARQKEYQDDDKSRSHDVQ